MPDPIEGDTPDVANSTEPLAEMPAKALKFLALCQKNGYETDVRWARGRLLARRRVEDGTMPEVVETYTTVSVRATRPDKPKVVGIWTTANEFFSGGIGTMFDMGPGIQRLEREVKRDASEAVS